MAYLMQTEEMDASTAQATVTALRHQVKPNDGFLEQLKIWEEMGCKFDPSHPYAKRKTLQSLQEHQASGEVIEKEELAEPSSNANGDKVSSLLGESNLLIYWCPAESTLSWSRILFKAKTLGWAW